LSSGQGNFSLSGYDCVIFRTSIKANKKSNNIKKFNKNRNNVKLGYFLLASVTEKNILSI